MIKFEKTEVAGWEPAIRGMRNPMNSWDKSDTYFDDPLGEAYTIIGSTKSIEGRLEGCGGNYLIIGPNDHGLMKRLAKAGSVHAKYRRMIVVYADITAPLYWWKEFDTYKIGTVANSCSTMHKIHAKEFTDDDFSIEHLYDAEVWHKERGDLTVDCEINFPEAFEIDYPDFHLLPYGVFRLQLAMLNKAREQYLKTQDKRYWWQMIQLLPTSYNQKRTVMLNYEVLENIYQSRKDHKLDEWRDFCCWIEKLPYSEIITPILP